MVKKIEREKARSLRSQGASINEISQQLSVAKSSVSVWVRDIVLSESQRHWIETKRPANIALCKQAKINRQRAQEIRDKWRLSAYDSLRVSRDPLIYAFAGLYWGEGIKNKNVVALGTSDPDMLQFFVEFIQKTMLAPTDKLALSIIIHPGLGTQQAEDFWLTQCKLPISCLRKTTVVVPTSSKQAMNHRCPFGTARVSWANTEARSTIEGWITALKERHSYR